MSFDLISDLHLTFRNEKILSGLVPKSDVLALLGDVCEIKNYFRFKKFFEFISSSWDYVLYVPGNHEFYGGEMEQSVDDMRSYLKQFRNIIVLDNDLVSIDNVRYIGSTLWSGMNRRNKITMESDKEQISDYHHIKRKKFGKEVLITPEDTVDMFEKNVEFIDRMIKISPFETNVILTHHAPSYRSVSPKFEGNIASAAYVSDLEYLLCDRTRVSVWAHGHTHSSSDYKIGACRVVANPLGYTNELYSDERKYKPLTVGVF